MSKQKTLLGLINMIGKEANKEEENQNTEPTTEGGEGGEGTIEGTGDGMVDEGDVDQADGADQTGGN